MSKSILSNERKCWVCGSTINLHKHHIFFGIANRKLSEKYGCWVYLCAYHHNFSNRGVHSDKELDLKLKRECQKKWEDVYGGQNFIEVFGRNYL